jgi:radical SAM protein with 4Fe4S-binding SPASM domain
VEFVAMRRNHREIADLLRLATEMRLDYVLISNVLPYSEAMAGQTLYGNGAVDLRVSPWHQWHWGGERLRVPEMRLRTERLCRFVERAAFVVAADGAVSPCYALMHSHVEYVFGRKKRVERWAVGDARERSLVDIWTDEGYVRFRSRVRRFAFPSCPDCPAVDGCYFGQSNAEDCWGNAPTCADCLWSRGMILCF